MCSQICLHVHNFNENALQRQITKSHKAPKFKYQARSIARMMGRVERIFRFHSSRSVCVRVCKYRRSVYIICRQTKTSQSAAIPRCCL